MRKKEVCVDTKEVLTPPPEEAKKDKKKNIITAGLVIFGAVGTVASAWYFYKHPEQVKKVVEYAVNGTMTIARVVGKGAVKTTKYVSAAFCDKSEAVFDAINVGKKVTENTEIIDTTVKATSEIVKAVPASEILPVAPVLDVIPVADNIISFVEVANNTSKGLGVPKAPHSVSWAVRNLPMGMCASEEAKARAAALGVLLDEGQTFVRAYQTGLDAAAVAEVI